MQIEPYLSPHTKFKFKWIEQLNIKQDTLNLINRNLEIASNVLVQGKFCEQNSNGSGSKINNWQMEPPAIETLCKEKDIVNITKGNLLIGKNLHYTYI